MTHKVTVQVLNGATGEIREVIVNVTASDEQNAVNKVFSHARKDDFYYRFLAMHGVLSPTIDGAKQVTYETQTYWALEI